MLIKNILAGVIVLAAVCRVPAQTTRSLTADEVRAHKLSKMKLFPQPAGGKFYPRKYAPVPGEKLRAELRRVKTLKWAFCEALVNTVVRTLTRGLRQNNANAAKNKIVSWRADRKSFIFKYKAIVKDGVITREECVLKFLRMPALRTLNGKMPGCPDISRKQLRRILYCLKKGNIEVKKVNIGLKTDLNEAENLLDYLNIEGNSNVYICSAAETAPQIKIILK